MNVYVQRVYNWFMGLKPSKKVAIGLMALVVVIGLVRGCVA